MSEAFEDPDFLLPTSVYHNRDGFGDDGRQICFCDVCTDSRDDFSKIACLDADRKCFPFVPLRGSVSKLLFMFDIGYVDGKRKTVAQLFKDKLKAQLSEPAFASLAVLHIKSASIGIALDLTALPPTLRELSRSCARSGSWRARARAGRAARRPRIAARCAASFTAVSSASAPPGKRTSRSAKKAKCDRLSSFLRDVGVYCE